ncbi:MAG: hypothetical protein NZM12_08130, partial [Steroidobacteraceae bacterium]|nr:hypothetical protein [Steroidobacteraceae bacterium]MDW8258082.1 hypothetical protein [Gammaproteobacteria bacterium]
MIEQLRTAMHRPATLVLLALSLAMLATRVEHFGTAVRLPDASLAVFILAGWAGGGIVAYAILLALAVGIDLWAVTFGGVSADCITPAYPALALAYGVLFGFGRAVRDRAVSWKLLPALVGVLALAFAISNLSF